jgi:hypothetical protein
MKIDIVIATAAAWDERRKAPLERLVCALPGTPLIVESPVREHANIWARRLWELIAHNDVGASSPAATIVLNDDVEPIDGLVERVAQLTELLPDDVLSLHGNFPGLVDAAKISRLARCYHPTGPGYSLVNGAARSLLAWIDTTPREWFGGDVNEDGVIASWLWSTQKPAYVTIPALVRHDVSVPSTLDGYDLHPGRSSCVDWIEYPVRPFTKADVDNAPHVPVPWMSETQFMHLSYALRGLVPLCAVCNLSPASLVNHARKTGVCRDCAGKIVGVEKSGGRDLTPAPRPRGVASMPAGSKPTFALAIPHCPWVEGRTKSLDRLRYALGYAADEDEVDRSRYTADATAARFGEYCKAFAVFQEKEPTASWSERLWSWFESKGDVTHALQLQDDDRVSPNFWPALSALVQAFPDDVIALHSMHTGARTLAREGIHAYSTTDGIVGTGYVIPKSAQPAFKGWREHELKPGSRHQVSEDTVLAMFCMSTGRRIVSPCPTIIDHDLTIPSSAGPERERQDFRRPAVTWEDLDLLGGELRDLESPEYWLAGGGPVNLGTFYAAVDASCLMHVRSFTMADAERARAVECPARFQRFLRM